MFEVGSPTHLVSFLQMYEYFFYFQVHFLVYSKKMIEMFIWSGRKV